MSKVANQVVTPLRTFGMESTIKVYVRDYDPAVAEKTCVGKDWGIANPIVIEWKAALWAKLKARPADFQKFIDVVVFHHHVPVYFENSVAEWEVPKYMEAFLTSIHELPEDLTDEYDHFFSGLCLKDIIACVKVEYVSVICMGRDAPGNLRGVQERAELNPIPAGVRKEMNDLLSDKENDSYWNQLSQSDAVFQNQYEIVTCITLGVGGSEGAYADEVQLMRTALSVSPAAQDILFDAAVHSAFKDDCLMESLTWGEEPLDSILFRSFFIPKGLSTRQDEWEETNAWQRRAFALMLPAIAALPEKERIEVVAAAFEDDLTEVFRLATVSAETTLRRDGVEIVPVVEPEDEDHDEDEEE
jgi:hypothetical protein